MRRFFIVVIMLLFVGCKASWLPWVKTPPANLIKTKTMPTQYLSQQKVKSIIVASFDARTAELIDFPESMDYVSMGQRFADDLINEFYKTDKIKVILGQFAKSEKITDTIQKQSGTLEVEGSLLKKETIYETLRSEEVNAIINGKIYYIKNNSDDIGKSYIKLSIVVSHPKEGTVFWISDMEGYYKDVLYTIAHTIINGKYTPAGGEVTVPETSAVSSSTNTSADNTDVLDTTTNE